MLMNKIINADALETLRTIDTESVDCCVTSPPYYGLRDYGAEGQIGLETSPQEYITKLTAVFREVRRVLKSDGTLWLNMGDSYAGSRKGRNSDGEPCKGSSVSRDKNNRFGGVLLSTRCSEYKRKDLMGIPWRLAFALQNDGWYLRQDIIWHKPNCMPESVKDRCTCAHEYIFLLSKNAKYFFDNEAIKEPAVTTDRTPRGSKGTKTPNASRRKQNALHISRYEGFNDRYFAEEGKPMRNKRDVWTVATKGYKNAHFATFPPELVKPCILAGSHAGGIVLDPFGGSGTVGEVAKELGRDYILIDINSEYCGLMEGRLCKEGYNGTNY